MGARGVNNLTRQVIASDLTRQVVFADDLTCPGPMARRVSFGKEKDQYTGKDVFCFFGVLENTYFEWFNRGGPAAAHDKNTAKSLRECTDNQRGEGLGKKSQKE